MGATKQIIFSNRFAALSDDEDLEVESAGDTSSSIAVEGSEKDEESDSSDSEDGDEGSDDSDDSDDESDEEEAKEDDEDEEQQGERDSWAMEAYPPLDLNYEALRHITDYYLPGNHGNCTDIEPLTRGACHEVRLLIFEDGWSCIGRFSRSKVEHVAVFESEIGTVKYVKKHTDLPVPDIYYYNSDPNNAVGAAFALVERLPGTGLYRLWDDLTLQHKFHVVTQLADVRTALADLKFDKIGSININGEIGPVQRLVNPEGTGGRGPFESMKDYARSFVTGEGRAPDKVTALYPEVDRLLEHCFEEQKDNPILSAPYRLIHGDFDAQNLLFTQEDPSHPPKLTGVIDWDNSYTGPLYYLYEYPPFIRDTSFNPENYESNKVLRQIYVLTLALNQPKDSQDRENILECFRQKCFALNGFENIFASRPWDPMLEEMVVGMYIKGLTTNVGEPGYQAYGGRASWEPDEELEIVDEDEEDEDEEEEQQQEELQSDDGGQATGDFWESTKSLAWKALPIVGAACAIAAVWALKRRR